MLLLGARIAIHVTNLDFVLCFDIEDDAITIFVREIIMQGFGKIFLPRNIFLKLLFVARLIQLSNKTGDYRAKTFFVCHAVLLKVAKLTEIDVAMEQAP